MIRPVLIRVSAAMLALSGATAAPASPRQPLVVVLDAGHGGHDPGSLSPSEGRRAEKTVTLAIARAVRDRLDGRRDVRIVLTRSDDRFLSLAARRRIAEASRADLFVSIHADSAPNARASGASVYTLTEDGRLVVANRMAAAASLDGIALAGLDRDVAAVLGDIKQRFAMNGAAMFATRLEETLSPVVAVRPRFVHAARFAVLKARGIPAALIETGYMTNADDAALLFSKSGQKRIAKAIAKAIVETADAREDARDDAIDRVAMVTPED